MNDLTRCNNDCRIPTTTYNCNSNYQCVPVSGNGGTYADLTACQSACQRPRLATTYSYTVNVNAGFERISLTSQRTGESRNASCASVSCGAKQPKVVLSDGSRLETTRTGQRQLGGFEYRLYCPSGQNVFGTGATYKVVGVGSGSVTCQ